MSSVSSPAHAAADAGKPDAGDAGKPSIKPSPAIDGPSHGTIAVPASVIAKAIEKKDVTASNATGADGKPLGAQIHGASKYRTGIRDGDVVIFVAGTRTETTDAMVGVATRALMSGATRLSGKILRGSDEVWDVVLELPHQ